MTTSTWGHRRLLQSKRSAQLLIDVLYSYRDQGRYQLHEFVVMPDHLHLLLSVGPETTIERAVQFIKGGFSYRVTRETGYRGEIWQRGFSEVRILSLEDYRAKRHYIHENPVRANLVERADEFAYSSAHPRHVLDRAPTFSGAKALGEGSPVGTTEVVP